MQTVGEILKQERKKQGKTLSQIHRETKIPEETLKSLENNNFSCLPAAAFVKGFIRSYSQALDLEPKKLIAIFRRSWQENEKGEIIPKGLVEPLNKTSIKWTPQTTLILTVSFFLFVFLGFIFFQLTNLLQPPKLTLNTPKENQQVHQETILVSGKASKEASVYVNDVLVKTDNKGNFSYQLKLFSGQNTIEVKAVDRQGKEKTIKRTVDKKS